MIQMNVINYCTVLLQLTKIITLGFNIIFFRREKVVHLECIMRRKHQKSSNLSRSSSGRTLKSEGHRVLQQLSSSSSLPQAPNIQPLYSERQEHHPPKKKHVKTEYTSEEVRWRRTVAQLLKTHNSGSNDLGSSLTLPHTPYLWVTLNKSTSMCSCFLICKIKVRIISPSLDCCKN